jgi:hypothetical protein
MKADEGSSISVAPEVNDLRQAQSDDDPPPPPVVPGDEVIYTLSSGERVRGRIQYVGFTGGSNGFSSILLKEKPGDMPLSVNVPYDRDGHPGTWRTEADAAICPNVVVGDTVVYQAYTRAWLATVAEVGAGIVQLILEDGVGRGADLSLWAAYDASGLPGTWRLRTEEALAPSDDASYAARVAEAERVGAPATQGDLSSLTQTARTDMATIADVENAIALLRAELEPKDAEANICMAPTPWNPSVPDLLRERAKQLRENANALDRLSAILPPLDGDMSITLHNLLTSGLYRG